MRTTENRIFQLENTVKNMKSVYPVAGSLVRIHKSESGVFTSIAAANSGAGVCRVRFVPTRAGTLVNIYAEASLNGQFGINSPLHTFHMEPVSADGSVVAVCTVNVMSTSDETCYFRFKAIGGSDGTFYKV